MGQTTGARTDDCEPYYRESQRGFLALKLVVEVRTDGVYVRFGPVQRSFRRIGFEDLTSVEVATYDPAEHGGWHWGLRVGPTGETTAYRISGDGGVRLTRSDGTRVFVGSEDPAAFADAIREAMEEAE